MCGLFFYLGDINISFGICNWVYGVGFLGELFDIISFFCIDLRKNFICFNCLYDYFFYVDDKV